MKKLFFMALLASPMLLWAQRTIVPLSGNDWSITLDQSATFDYEQLYLPSEVDLSKLPVNLPTGGWALLSKPDKQGVHLPATVEEHLWGWNGETYGVAGNYVGVSWWETKALVPADWKGQRVVLDFEGVRFRAEIFVNHKLAGYDVVNSTPFGIDVTDFLEYGIENTISVRITDPNGNFNWKDSQNYKWGKYLTNPSHGFGGIPGHVQFTVTPWTRISDVFVMNKPAVSSVDVQVTAMSRTDVSAPLTLVVKESVSGKEVFRKQQTVSLKADQENVVTIPVNVSNAKLWSPDEPNLYRAEVQLADGTQTDQVSRRFGFRWFEVRDVKGEKMFFLNGKRIVVRTAISWSFWPYNGAVPDETLARRQIESAKAMGLNMLNFHRTLGTNISFDLADELGLLFWEEPGGNQYSNKRLMDGSETSEFYIGYRNEKLIRMMKRDRSHPSLIIYNLHNERGSLPCQKDYDEMRLGHSVDPTRILVYNSSNGKNPEGLPDPRVKTHYLPYDTTTYQIGWWDQHHAGGPGVYHDGLYTSATEFHRSSANKGEIVYWGEEGAIGTPPRLQLIRDEILKSGRKGWEYDDYLKWYDAYDGWLNAHPAFRKAYPTVDDLTRNMGNVALYYQGRTIENMRMDNVADGYAVNGWESMKLENHSGIVDCYRFTKGDAEVMGRYVGNPLYLPVKLTHKVIPAGTSTQADIWIINEQNLKGSFTLQVQLKDAEGRVVDTRKQNVKVSGGTVYGENLANGFVFDVAAEGYYTVEAKLLKGSKPATATVRGQQVEVVGSDDLFAVGLSTDGIIEGGQYADTTSMLKDFFAAANLKLKEYKKGTPEGSYLVVGSFEPTQFGSGISDILEWVYSGHTLIVIDNVERWSELFADKEILDYRGSKPLGKSWYGGNTFNCVDPIFDGLPQGKVFNWEYQCFAQYNRRRLGLRVASGEVLAACVADHRKEVYASLVKINAGRGQIYLCTLDIPACIRGINTTDNANDKRAEQDNIDGMNESMNSLSSSKTDPANAVAHRLLLNMLRQCRVVGK